MIKMNNQKIAVSIFNQTFEISSQTLSNEQLKELAVFVDEKMKNIFASTKLSSALKIAVLTSLNLAEELFVLKKNAKEIHQPSLSEIEITQILINFTKKIQRISDNVKLYDTKNTP